jgi:hypothetical protein
MQASKLQPVILGGLFFGVLSALPIISMGNCCCLWVIGGGIIAAYLLQQGQPGPITPGDGAIVGLLAGVVGAFVHAVVSIPVLLVAGPLQARMMEGLLNRMSDANPDLRSLAESMHYTGAGAAIGVIISFVFMLIVGVLFGALGGMLGALFFKKDLPPAPPQPPASFPPPFNPPPLP